MHGQAHFFNLQTGLQLTTLLSYLTLGHTDMRVVFMPLKTKSQWFSQNVKLSLRAGYCGGETVRAKTTVFAF